MIKLFNSNALTEYTWKREDEWTFYLNYETNFSTSTTPQRDFSEKDKLLTITSPS